MQGLADQCDGFGDGSPSLLDDVGKRGAAQRPLAIVLALTNGLRPGVVRPTLGYFPSSECSTHLHALVLEVGGQIYCRMNFEVTDISPIIDELTNIVVTACFED